MVLRDPLLNHTDEFFSLRDNLCGLGFGSHKSIVVVDHVPLAPASVEVATEWVCGLVDRELNNVKGNPVMPRANNAVAGTSNAIFAACNAALYAVAKRLSADTPSRDASAMSRAMTARSLSSSFFDVLCR